MGKENKSCKKCGHRGWYTQQCQSGVLLRSCVWCLKFDCDNDVARWLLKFAPTPEEVSKRK